MQRAATLKIDYGKTTIRFALDRTSRKTLAIHVYPDKHVEVVAPEWATKEKIFAKVRKRASWIVKQQLEFSRIPPEQPRPEFVSGESFRYLGKQYRLRVIEQDGTSQSVKLLQGRIVMQIPPDTEESKKEALMLSWYRDRAKTIFEERFMECMKDAHLIGIKRTPEWRVKVMAKRWGSCTKEGVVYLNPELVAAPKPSIDYVIYHEMCHIVEHNHSGRFFDLLTKVYPEWKKWRDFLNERIEVRLV